MNPAFALLLEFFENCESACLLVADENLHDADFGALSTDTTVLSNRFDVALAARRSGLKTYFSDFDFEEFDGTYFACIGYRLSKEKAAVEHIIQAALSALPVGGALMLSGAKNEGIKRYATLAGKLFGNPCRVRKHGAWYSAHVVKSPGRESNIACDYGRLMPLSADPELFTRPGLFGANKIDRGSALLAEFLDVFFTQFARPPQSVLDLGCGYGYLAMQCARKGVARVVATDNCAAAIEACRANFQRHHVSGEVIADDCANGISEFFEGVICNPPFHQGFKTDARLTEKFVRAAANHLYAKGKALFVVNEFVGLEKCAGNCFCDFQTLAKRDGFKLVAMTRR